MIIITSDINKQTYIPALKSLLSIFTVLQEKASQNFRICLCSMTGKIQSFFLRNVPHVSHLGFLMPCAHFLFC